MVAPDLPREAEVVVVGGGCMGASIAFHLARRELEVVLLEKGHVAGGATGHSGALVRQHYEARIGIRLARESLAFFRRFEKETGFSCDFQTTGFLSGTRERDLPAFDAMLELLRSVRDCPFDTFAAKSQSCDDRSISAHLRGSISISTGTHTRGRKRKRRRWPAIWTRISGRRCETKSSSRHSPLQRFVTFVGDS